MINGIPARKYHFRVLCLKANIPAYTPTLPNAAAMKNKNPSEILSAPLLLDFTLSANIEKKAIRLIDMKKVDMAIEAFSIRIF